MYGYFKIFINGKPYFPEFQTEARYATGWKKALHDAHAIRQTIQIQCQCCQGTDETRLLDVKCLKDTFYLAKKKLTGPEHRHDCRFYAPDTIRSGYGAYTDSAIDDDDGVIRIKVGMGLQVRDDPAGSVISSEERRTGTKIPRVTLLGLLHLLWDKAGLNDCYPASIGMRSNAAHRLYKSASAVHIGRAKLQKHLLVFDRKVSEYKALLAASKSQRLFVIAPLSPWASTELSENSVLHLAEARGMPETMQLIPGLWEKTLRSFNLAVAAWRRGDRIMALAQIEPTQSVSTWEVVGMCLMQITDNWIAVESSYEKQIADELVKAGRRFEKPLRFDAGEEVVFPDFILRDAGNEPRGIPMEVFGRSGETYAKRQSEKEAYYNAQFGVNGWWHWQPLTGEAIPVFPPKVEV